MKIQTSTCHICLEELSFDSKDIKKKCCPTKAFICNNCWENLKKNKDTVKCPLCNSPFDIEIDLVSENDNLLQTINIENSNRCDKIRKYIKYFLISLIVGMFSSMIIVYFLHSNSTTFKKELIYLISILFNGLCHLFMVIL